MVYYLILPYWWTDFNAELRITKFERLNEVVEYYQSQNRMESFIIWIKQNEGQELKKINSMLAIEISGSDSDESKEQKEKTYRWVSLKFLSLNLRFASMGFQLPMSTAFKEFAFTGFLFWILIYKQSEEVMQIRTKKNVNIYLITTDRTTMSNASGNQSLNKKQNNLRVMQAEMSKAINKYLKGTWTAWITIWR